MQSLAPNFWQSRDQANAVLVRETHFSRTDLRCFEDRLGTAVELLAHAIARSPDADALVIATNRVSYRDLGETVLRLACGLANIGVTRGDRVGILMENSVEFVQCLLATMQLGAVAVPINVRLRRPEIDYIVSQSGARVVALDQSGADRWPHNDREGTPTRVVAGMTPREGEYAFAGLVRADQGAPPRVDVGEDDPALLMYTSGTTGRPKGAIVTHLGLIHAARIYAWAMDLGPEERSIMAVPASHITGITANIFSMLGVAGCTVILPKFDAETFIESVAVERVTHTVMVPAMYKLCLMRAALSAYDLSCWRIGGYGGAPMPEATIAELADAVPTLNLCNIYGATETTGPVIMMPIGHTKGRGDSIGQVLPCFDIDIIRDDGCNASANEKGELRVKGPSVVPGYWDNNAATLDNFSDGFWMTGDIGYVDADGYVYLVDRLKDVINRGGYKIYSIEVENVLNFHPEVVESAVVATADPVIGEKTHAHVRVKDSSLDEAAVREYCASRLADYKVPDFVSIREDPLPRNANGKLLKTVLRDEV